MIDKIIYISLFTMLSTICINNLASNHKMSSPDTITINGVTYVLFEGNIINVNGKTYLQEPDIVRDEVPALKVNYEKTAELQSILNSHPILIGGVIYDFLKNSPGSVDTLDHLNIHGIPKQLIVRNCIQYRLSKSNRVVPQEPPAIGDLIQMEASTYCFTGNLSANSIEKPHLNKKGLPKELIVRNGKEYKLVRVRPIVEATSSKFDVTTSVHTLPSSAPVVKEISTVSPSAPVVKTGSAKTSPIGGRSFAWAGNTSSDEDEDEDEDNSPK